MTAKMMILVNRKTGKIHRGYRTNSPMCNQCGDTQIPQLSEASETRVAAATEAAFCRKCFPDGKPA